VRVEKMNGLELLAAIVIIQGFIAVEFYLKGLFSRRCLKHFKREF
jgi:hypothetical protein